MISKYYSDNIEKRSFYCISINGKGELISGRIETMRATKSSYEVIRCDFNISLQVILDKNINVARKIIVADNKEIAEKLYKQAYEKGLIKVVGHSNKNKFNINLDNKYKNLVKEKIIEDVGGYFSKYRR